MTKKETGKSRNQKKISEIKPNTLALCNKIHKIGIICYYKNTVSEKYLKKRYNTKILTNDITK